MNTRATAARITRQSKSNLALAFISLGRERKRDITVFYAFCRVIDDIADSLQLSIAEKQVRLAEWREMLCTARSTEPPLARDVRALIDKYSLAVGMLEEIIAGVEMDITIRRYATFEELRVYCYRVASAVGLVSIEIFGYRNPRCKEYAVELGLALQMTNATSAKICAPTGFICRKKISHASTIPKLSCKSCNTTNVLFVSWASKPRVRGSFSPTRRRRFRERIAGRWCLPRLWAPFTAACFAE